jgi:hypothetical protein
LPSAPGPKTGLNIATVSGTGFSETFPQIGWVDFTQDRDGEVTGTTDQGCAWEFVLESDKLQLASPGQACFSKVIGSRYQYRARKAWTGCVIPVQVRTKARIALVRCVRDGPGRWGRGRGESTA